MPSPEQFDRIEDLAEEILDIVGGGDPGEPGEPGVLQPPTKFKVKWDKRTRRATARWIDAAGAVATEVHETLTEPDETLKATVPAGVGERESSELAGGHPYAYRLRSVGPDGEVSAFTELITIDVPRKGDDEPDDDDNDDDNDGEDDGGDDEQPSEGGPHPSDVLPVLEHWTIMLPTGSPGDPDNEYLVGKSIPDTYFVREDEHGVGVVFRTYPATACHSENSKYGRTEGRQMQPPPAEPWEKSAWPSGSEDEPAEPQHLHARMRIDLSRLDYPIGNAAQIHDGGDDVMQVQSRDGVLGIAHKDGKAWEVIDPDYGTDGAPFVLDIRTTGRGELIVDYNDREAVRIEKTGSGWYWKSGSYPNTGGANDDRPEDPGSYAEVVIYELTVDPA